MHRPALLASLLLTACPGDKASVEPTSPPDASTIGAGAGAGAGASPDASDPTPLDQDAIAAIVSASDREDGDREADARRKPTELLAFVGITPGMKVADIGAGLGYTTELLARAVGPEGTVYGQNPRFVLERFAEEGWSERLAKPVNANVIRLDREFDDPFPPELDGQLDAVINVMFYHDFEWQGVDRAAHNAAVLRALRPGGTYVIVDHSAQDGAGASGSETLHRIEEALVIEELEAAGFVLERQADFLRNPSDTRDWNALPWRSGREELSDRFVLAFVKPR